MIKETVATFTEEDFKLLSMPSLHDPCEYCSDKWFSCERTCIRKTKYDEKIKAYKDAGILEYANIIGDIRAANELIRLAKKELNALIDNLPDEIVRNKNIKFKEWEINNEG